jgi:mycofactocin precursor
LAPDGAAAAAELVEADVLVEAELLVEDVSIDGMCGVY